MHPEQEEIVRFLRGELATGKAEALYGHIDRCEPCLERYRALRRLQGDFEASWSSFEAEWAHRRDSPGSQESTHPNSALRLQSVLDGARRLATWAAEAGLVAGAPLGLGTTFKPSYGGVGDPGDPVLGLQHEAATRLGQDDAAAALDALARIAVSQPEAAATSEVELSVQGTVVGRVVIEARRRAIAVLLQNDFLATRHLQAVARATVRAEEGTRAFVAPLQPVTGAPYHLAELEELPDGVLDLQLELYAQPPA